MARRSRSSSGIDLAAAAALVDGELHGDPGHVVDGVAEPEDASASDAVFCAKKRHLEAVRETRAGVVLLPPGLEPDFDATGRNLIRVANPHLAIALLIERLYPVRSAPAGVHPAAELGERVELGADVSVGAGVSVGTGAVIGARTEIGPGCSIADNVVIGEDCLLNANVSLYDDTTLGDRVILHSGVVLGADGFGYARDGARSVKVPQIGGVLIESDVEIGANSCVDRGTFRRTRVGRGSKIDNLVQIGHNCDIGENCTLSGQVGLSGSTVLEDGVILGGNVGTAGHLVIGKGAMVAAKAGVHTDLPPGSVGGGMPYVDIRTWRRMVAALPKLPGLLRRVRRLEKRPQNGQEE